MSKDVVDILRDAGYGVVEGKDEVLALIARMEEMANMPKDANPYERKRNE